jgi:hypothetical protein
VIVLGIIALVAGFLLNIPVLWSIGIVLVVIRLILEVLGAMAAYWAAGTTTTEASSSGGPGGRGSSVCEATFFETSACSADRGGGAVQPPDPTGSNSREVEKHEDTGTPGRRRGCGRSRSS